MVLPMLCCVYIQGVHSGVWSSGIFENEYGILNNSVSNLDGLGILRLGLGTYGFGYTGCPFCFFWDTVIYVL